MDRLAVRGCNPDIARKNLDMVIENSESSDVFEVDVTSLVRTLGRNITKLIAKGIVQDHYSGDWSKVRFIGLEAV